MGTVGKKLYDVRGYDKMISRMMAGQQLPSQEIQMDSVTEALHKQRQMTAKIEQSFEARLKQKLEERMKQRLGEAEQDYGSG